MADLETNLNDAGHTIYPKYVYPNAVKDDKGKVKELGAGVIVKDKKEEDEAMKGAKTSSKEPVKEPWPGAKA